MRRWRIWGLSFPVMSLRFCGSLQRPKSAWIRKTRFFHPEVRTAAGRLRQLPEENPDSKRAVGGNSWLELIIRVLEHLVATGYLLEFQEQGDEVVEYRPTPAYQSAMRTAAVYAFHAFRELVADQKAVVSAGKDREASPRDPSGEMSYV